MIRVKWLHPARLEWIRLGPGSVWVPDPSGSWTRSRLTSAAQMFRLSRSRLVRLYLKSVVKARRQPTLARSLYLPCREEKAGVSVKLALTAVTHSDQTRQNPEFMVGSGILWLIRSTFETGISRWPVWG